MTVDLYLSLSRARLSEPGPRCGTVPTQWRGAKENAFVVCYVGEIMSES